MAQLCLLILCDPMDYRPPNRASLSMEFSQARLLGGGCYISFSTGLQSLAKGATVLSQVNLMEGRSDKYVRACSEVLEPYSNSFGNYHSGKGWGWGFRRSTTAHVRCRTSGLDGIMIVLQMGHQEVQHYPSFPVTSGDPALTLSEPPFPSPTR